MRILLLLILIVYSIDSNGQFDVYEIDSVPKISRNEVSLNTISISFNNKYYSFEIFTNYPNSCLAAQNSFSWGTITLSNDTVFFKDTNTQTITIAVLNKKKKLAIIKGHPFLLNKTFSYYNTVNDAPFELSSNFKPSAKHCYNKDTTSANITGRYKHNDQYYLFFNPDKTFEYYYLGLLVLKGKYIKTGNYLFLIDNLGTRIHGIKYGNNELCISMLPALYLRSYFYRY